MALALILAAVAGGNLATTIAPEHPRVGQRVEVRSTGQVGDRGRLYVYRNRSRRCAQTARGERRRGELLGKRAIVESFDMTVRFRVRRARTEWVCAYLYAITCDAAGQNCGPATGLPPDAGFAQVRVRVRPASQSVKSSGGSGRVIT